MTLLLETELPALPHAKVPWHDTLADVLRTYPDAESVLVGLRGGGWRLGEPSDTSAYPQGLRVTFMKEFVGATPIDACEDARRCGVSDELGPVFDWAPDRGDDDDGTWDRWEGEL